MDQGAWWAAVHGVATSQTQLSDFTFTFHFHALVEEMATHSRILAWRIPGMGEPGGLPSMGSHTVGHDWSDLAAAAAAAVDFIWLSEDCTVLLNHITKLESVPWDILSINVILLPSAQPEISLGRTGDIPSVSWRRMDRPLVRRKCKPQRT